jgi:hypothetical protein
MLDLSWREGFEAPVAAQSRRFCLVSGVLSAVICDPITRLHPLGCNGFAVVVHKALLGQHQQCSAWYTQPGAELHRRDLAAGDCLIAGSAAKA